MSKFLTLFVIQSAAKDLLIIIKADSSKVGMTKLGVYNFYKIMIYRSLRNSVNDSLGEGFYRMPLISLRLLPIKIGTR